MIANARSYKKSQVSLTEVITAVGRFREDDKIKYVTARLDEIEDYIPDVWFVDGDLHIPGDLDLTREQVWFLVVLGDLVVDGVYGDSDHPESFLLVTGNMRARDVVTAGWLEVHGDLSTDRLIGDCNDCSAYIGGDVPAAPDGAGLVRHQAPVASTIVQHATASSGDHSCRAAKL